MQKSAEKINTRSRHFLHLPATLESTLHRSWQQVVKGSYSLSCFDLKCDQPIVYGAAGGEALQGISETVLLLNDSIYRYFEAFLPLKDVT